MTRIAIMQPTFLPWLGYFALIDRVDRFLFLDDVQFSRQSWQSRNRLKGPEGAVILPLAVARKPSRPLIRDARLAETGFEGKLIATAENLLAKTPHGDLALSILRQGFDRARGSLAALNIAIIESICTATGIDTPRQTTGSLGVGSGEKTDRLIRLCQHCGAGGYLSPIGSAAYLEGDDSFDQAGIDLAFLNYTHPVYPQRFSPFLSHLSALDALAHVGPDAFLPLVRSGVGPDLTLTDLKDIHAPT
ncbi:WbqC family protein [Oceaniglobus trochenteri]|uniref:WbqC family protein n=1 Tax=Oceaniglobus trochenteri TaxID=2763260 RepID=UPI001D00003C|nr:WbqC family protein [Oceaniglobus trochenteri]